MCRFNTSISVSYTHLDVYKRQSLASQYAMSCRTGQTCFLTCINGAFALLIPAALLLASGGDVRAALVNFIFYALFAPACGQMINRIMYMSEAVMLSLIHIFTKSFHHGTSTE